MPLSRVFSKSAAYRFGLGLVLTAAACDVLREYKSNSSLLVEHVRALESQRDQLHKKSLRERLPETNLLLFVG